MPTVTGHALPTRQANTTALIPAAVTVAVSRRASQAAKQLGGADGSIDVARADRPGQTAKRSDWRLLTAAFGLTGERTFNSERAVDKTHRAHRVNLEPIEEAKRI
jgi:hypothetical protein